MTGKCTCQGDWWGGEHVTGCAAKPAEPPRVEVKLMTAWLPAPRVEIIDDYGPRFDEVYPGLRAALAEHEPHDPYATSVQNSALGYRAARCSACNAEIWSVGAVINHGSRSDASASEPPKGSRLPTLGES